MATVITSIPELRTERLLLRPITEADLPAIVNINGDLEVSRHTLTIPHPYTIDDARAFLGRIAAGVVRGETFVWLITRPDQETPGAAPEPIGTIGLKVEPAHFHAELGYLLAVSAWGKGYATEAANAAVRFCFETLRLERVHATYYSANAASGRVLEKCGFVREGVRARMYYRFGEWRDAVLVRLFRSEWTAMHPEQA